MPGSTLRFDLYRDGTPPGAPGPTSYIGLWLHRLTLADGLAWSGLFDGTAGDFSFQSLEFEDGSVRSKTPAALAIDFDATGQQVTVRNELPFGTVKNAHVRDFDGTGLSLSGFFGVFLELAPNTHDQQVTVAKAQQGRVELGTGNDSLVIEAATDRSGNSRTFTVDAGDGNDTVTIAPSAGLWREAWITTNVSLGAGNDLFTGMGSHDSVFGGAGDDIAELRGGTNFFDGGAGYDTLVLRGLKASYRIDDLGQGRYRFWDNDRTTDGDDGITVIWNVEKVVFKDQDWIIRPPGNPNDPPVANDDGIFVVSGAQAFAYGVLLANDVDPDGNPLTIIAVGNAVGGTVLRDWANNQVIFTPAAGFLGPASFTYQVGDRQGGVAQAKVNLAVVPGGNAPPVAMDDMFDGTEDTPLAGSVAANDSDPDGNPLAYSLVGAGPAGLAFNPDGSFLYTPPANLNGVVTFTYQVSDGQGGTDTATVTVTLAAVEDSPISADDAASTAFETPVTIDVLANDLEVDGQPLSVILWAAPAQGMAVANPDNTLTFMPGAGFSGEATFSYRAFDGVGFGNVAVVTVTVGAPPNRPPVADDVVFTIAEDTPFAANLFGFTSDPDFNQASIQLLGSTNLTVTSFDGATGSIDVVPTRDFFGIATITYQVTDSGGLTDTGVVVLVVTPVNDAPVGTNDTASTAFETPVVISVLANDSDVDGDALVAGGTTAPANGTLSNVGGSITYTPNAGFSGVDRFTYRPFDGALQGNETTVTVTVAPPPPVGATVFYFSGSVPDFGRELWVYDPGSYDPTLGGPFATMVDAVELFPGPRGMNPTGITALGNTVFWRDIWDFPLPEDVEVPNTSWNFYNPASGLAGFFQTVDEVAFDAHLPLAARTLGVRSGDLFWHAIGIPGVGGGPADLIGARDAAGLEVGGASIPGGGRTLLTDAGHDPAYAAFIPTFDLATGSLFDAEQVFVVLWDPYAQFYTTHQATSTGSDLNDITAIAGLQVTEDFATAGSYEKTVYFAGDHTDGSGTFHTAALWRARLLNDGGGWSPAGGPEMLDLNGSFGAVPLDPYALTIAPVTDGHATYPESLFLFGRNAQGEGAIFALREDYFASFASSTESLYFFDTPFTGLEIRPWENGVVFSGIAALPGGDAGFVAVWTDDNGDGFFQISNSLFEGPGTIEHLVVDGQGNAAWVQDTGTEDTLWVFQTALGFGYGVVTVAGEIDGLQLADGHLVYRMEAFSGSFLTLFDHTLATQAGIEVPTDEPTDGPAGDGFLSRYANVAVQNASGTQGGLVFEANLGGGQGFRMLLADNGVVTGLNLLRYSEGTQFEGSWIGTGYRFDTAELGLFRVAADGTVSTLYAESTNFSFEAEILGNQVLFGTTSAATNRVLVHDIAASLTFTVLDDHLLGAASVVGNGIVFTALDFGNPLNSDIDPANNVWDLYRFDGSTTWLATLPTGAGGGQHVHEWWRHQHFLGDDSRILWKQANDATGVEVHTIDLTAADPAGTLAVIDTINPGIGDAANFPDATFANGRLYFQASTDGFFTGLALYTTTDGTDVAPVTGATAADAFSGAYLTVLLDGPTDDEVFFLARKDGQGSSEFGVFQVNDDGVTASLITPAGLGNAYGLAVLGSDLYVFAFDPVSNTGQMYRFTPSAQPAVASPQQLTFFTGINGAGSMDDIVLGGDGVVYFGRSEPGTGRELWMLDATEPTGARLVADLNQDTAAGGYAPEQVVAVPNPLEYWLAG